MISGLFFSFNIYLQFNRLNWHDSNIIPKPNVGVKPKNLWVYHLIKQKQVGYKFKLVYILTQIYIQNYNIYITFMNAFSL